MTKSKVMPIAKLIGAPLIRLAFTYIFPINNPACPECYTIELRVPPYSYTCKASFLHRQVRSNAHHFPSLCLSLSIFQQVFIYKALHIFYKGIAFFCQGVTKKRVCNTYLKQMQPVFKAGVTYPLSIHKLLVQKAIPYLENFILKKYVMLSSNAVFAFSQQRCCIPFLVQIFELRRHYLIAKNALHFLKKSAFDWHLKSVSLS